MQRISREEGNAVVAVVTKEELTMDDKIMAFLSGDDGAAENSAEFEERCMVIADYLRAEESRKADETAAAAERMSRLSALRSGVKVAQPDTDIMAMAMRAGVTFDGAVVTPLVRLYEVIHKSHGGQNPRTVRQCDSATLSRIAVAVQSFMADAGKPDVATLKQRKNHVMSHFDHCDRQKDYGKTYVNLIW